MEREKDTYLVVFRDWNGKRQIIPCETFGGAYEVYQRAAETYLQAAVFTKAIWTRNGVYNQIVE